MPYRTFAIVQQLIPSFATLVSEYQRATSDDLRLWLASLVGHACRELEDFLEPRVSLRAALRAREMQLGDLRHFHWDHQTRKMKDPDRSIFHWEHVVPVSSLRRELLELREVSAPSVESIIIRADVAWILKEEDAELTRCGFCSVRPDPDAAYAVAGIAFEPAVP